MKYLIIDASLSGTGIRDYYNGGYIYPEDLNLSSNLINKLEKWLSNYEDERYNNYSNIELIERLDEEGKEIALMVKDEIPDSKLSYYSYAKMKTLSI